MGNQAIVSENLTLRRTMTTLAGKLEAGRAGRSIGRLRGFIVALVALIGLAVLGAPAAEAAGSLSLKLSGNNVTYSGSGFPANTDVNVTVTNDDTGQGTTVSGTTDESGGLPQGTASPGKVKPGDTVSVEVKDKGSPPKVLANGSVTKPKKSIVADILKALIRIFG